MIHQAPTRPEERIDAIDIVRGFVLFGVLIVNATGTLAGPSVSNPNRVDWFLSHLIDGIFNYRSMATFSLLFGLGLAMQSDKARADGSSFASFLLRRQGALGALARVAGGGLRGGSLRVAGGLQPLVVGALPVRARRMAVAQHDLWGPATAQAPSFPGSRTVRLSVNA